MKKLFLLLRELRELKRVNVIYKNEEDEQLWVDRTFMFNVPQKGFHIQRDKNYYIVHLIVLDYDNYSHQVVEVHLNRY